MRISLRITATAAAIMAGAFLAPAGVANAATAEGTGGLRLNLETDCPDMTINPGQTQKDECVQLMQEDLDAMDATIDPDGYFGVETQGALVRFQRMYSTTDNLGDADHFTRRALQEDVAAILENAGYDPNAGLDAACDIGGDAVDATGKDGGALAGDLCKIIGHADAAY